MPSDFDVSFAADDDGLHNVLLISGGKVGTYPGVVRDLVTGFRHANFTHVHSEVTTVVVPASSKYVTVNLGDEEELRLAVDGSFLPDEDESEEERAERKAIENAIKAAKKAKASKLTVDPRRPVLVEPPNQTVPSIHNPEPKEQDVAKENPAEKDTATNAADPHNSGIPAPGTDLDPPAEANQDEPQTIETHIDSVDPDGNYDADDRQKQPEKVPSKAEKKKAGEG